MTEDEFILLAVKVLSGNHLPDEATLLQSLLSGNASYRSLFENLSIYWKSESVPVINEDLALEKIWKQIRQEPEAEIPWTPVKKINWKKILAAAALIPLIGMSWLFFTHEYRKTNLVEKYNQKGMRSMIILSDGTTVWLNADSRLKYPTAFQDNLREVYLEGEAFFNIAKNPARPFLIHLPDGTVKVLGTSFDIRSYPDEQMLSTSVATGRVLFIPDYKKSGMASDSFYLTANQKAEFDIGAASVNVKPTDALADKSWINGELIFTDETLAGIAIKLERSFGKAILFRDSAVSRYRYSATFKNNSEEEILNTLRKVKPFRYRVTDKFIEIDK